MNKEYPDILGACLRHWGLPPEYHEKRNVQYTGWLSPSVIPKNGWASLYFLFQNTLDVKNEVSIKIGGGTFLGGLFVDPLHISLRAINKFSFTLNDGEVSRVIIPIHAGEKSGTFELTIQVSPKRLGKGNRVRTTKGKGIDYIGPAIISAIGIGLATSLGFGFISTPSGKLIVELKVTREINTDTTPRRLVPQVKSIWTPNMNSVPPSM